jgi:hypothetical protein
MPTKTGWRLEITLYKTKLAKNPNGEKRYGTDYQQVGQEISRCIVLGTAKSEKEGIAQYEKARAAAGES